MPVSSVLAHLGTGMTVDDLLREWPELEREDVKEALGYAAWAMEECIISLPRAAA